MNPPGPHPRPPSPPPDGGRRPPASNADEASRRRRAALAGHVGDLDTARVFATDPEPGVRETALGAIIRAVGLEEEACARAASDPDARVRRRLAEELGRHGEPSDADGWATALLIGLLNDADPLTVEAAAWALGEVAGSGNGDRSPPRNTQVVLALVGAAGHEDPLVREAVVAALGAIGDPDGLATVLAGTTDRPAIRRRAVLALAPFLDEPGVDEALTRAAEDRDWQVRQAAEILRRSDP